MTRHRRPAPGGRDPAGPLRHVVTPVARARGRLRTARIRSSDRGYAARRGGVHQAERDGLAGGFGVEQSIARRSSLRVAAVSVCSPSAEIRDRWLWRWCGPCTVVSQIRQMPCGLSGAANDVSRVAVGCGESVCQPHSAEDHGDDRSTTELTENRTAMAPVRDSGGVIWLTTSCCRLDAEAEVYLDMLGWINMAGRSGKPRRPGMAAV